MSDHNGVDAVASGVPYIVTAVNGRVPGSLDDFGTDIVEVLASRRGNESRSLALAGA